jgi:hypothetical protein
MPCKESWHLNPAIKLCELTDGIATFNTFSGDTQFIDQPLNLIIKLLQTGAHSTKQINDLAIAWWPSQEPALIEGNITQFLIQAENSDIISAKSNSLFI